MPLEGKATYYQRNGPGYLIISAKVAQDSAFPFQHKEKLHVKIDPNSQKLIVAKKKGGEKQLEERR